MPMVSGSTEVVGVDIVTVMSELFIVFSSQMENLDVLGGLVNSSWDSSTASIVALDPAI